MGEKIDRIINGFPEGDLFRHLVEHMQGGIIFCYVDMQTKSAITKYVNAGWVSLTGYSLEELNNELEGNPHSLIYKEDQPIVNEAYRTQLKCSQNFELQYRIRRRDGKVIWVIDRGVLTILPNDLIFSQSVIIEVTQLKEQEEYLRQLTQVDQFTGLNNKVSFCQLAQKILLQQYKGFHALLIVDIDNFKHVNDTCGHAVGDSVLQEVASLLKGTFRSGDVVGRIGGDEFLVLMTDLCDMQAVKMKASLICDRIQRIRIPKDDKPLLTVSIGIATTKNAISYETLFEYADRALYCAKNNGKNQYIFIKGNECLE